MVSTAQLQVSLSNLNRLRRDFNTIFNDTVNPTDDTIGADGDFWLNTSSSTLFGPKDSGTWTGVPSVSLTGPTGATGATGATGPAGNTVTIDNSNYAGTPTGGVNGDIQFQFSGQNWYVWKKISGTWTTLAIQESNSGSSF